MQHTLPQNPVHIVISDLDGTLVPTYITLEAVHHLTEQFQKLWGLGHRDDAFSRLADIIKNNIDVQDILHSPYTTLRKITQAILKAQRGKNLPVSRHLHLADNGVKVILNKTRRLAERSFRKFPGAQAVLDTAREAGVPVVVHTATSAQEAITRLFKSGFSPNDFVAIYAKAPKAKDAYNAWAASLTGDKAAFAAKIRTYQGKKAATQVADILKEFNVRAHHALYIGDSVGDQECATENGIRFAHQRQGVTTTAVRMNDALRKKRLGTHHVDSKHPAVIPLSEGLISLLGLINNRHIKLEPRQYQGVTTLQWMPSDPRISDRILLKQIVTAARIQYFLNDDKAVRIDHSTMRANYGTLLCTETLEPLVIEAQHRAAGGSQECSLFLEAVDRVRRQYGDPHLTGNVADALINNIEYVRRAVGPAYTGTVEVPARCTQIPSARQGAALTAG